MLVFIEDEFSIVIITCVTSKVKMFFKYQLRYEAKQVFDIHTSDDFIGKSMTAGTHIDAQ